MVAIQSKTLVVTIKPPIKEMLDFAIKQINRRRNGWTLSTLEFEDVRQMLLIRIWKKYHLFDPKKGPLEHWVNRLISNALKNILRDNLMKFTRPCLGIGGGCVFNQGGDACSYTPSGKQCEECPLYAKWKQRKESQHNIKATLPLENHAQEVNNIQSDFTDYVDAKRRIDVIMLTQLTPFERRIYRMLVIRHMTPAEASEKLKKTMKKRKLREGEGIGYQALLRALSRFRDMIKLVIRQEGLG